MDNELTHKEKELLDLIKSSPEGVTRSQIVRKLWGGFASRASLNALVARLRKKGWDVKMSRDTIYTVDLK